MKIRDRIKELRRVPASELAPNPKNWRTHPAEQIDAIKGVLEEVGFAGAHLARELPDGTLQLIDGHARASIAGDAVVPVLVTDLGEEEANLILATFDPIGAMAGGNAAMLDELLREVATSNEALVAVLNDLAKDNGCEWAQDPPPEITEDDIPEAPVDPITKPGDLWILGGHRLLCGDSANAEDVRRVMQGERACCVFTDPPYGVAIGKKNEMLNSFQKAGKNLTSIVDDDLSPEDLQKKLQPAFDLVRTQVMSDDCTVFLTAPQGGDLGMMMMMMMKAAKLPIRHVLIWKKNAPTFSMGRLDYDYAHEPILLTWGKRHKRPMAGMHKTSVWEIDKPRASPEHPTMKPVELYANAYLNNSEPDDIVYEPYSGSGTAIVASEQVGRKCRAIEISPQYVDVAVKRWESLTGLKATLQKMNVGDATSSDGS